MEDTIKRPNDVYDPQDIEAKWQRYWAETGIYRTHTHPTPPTPTPAHIQTFYCLDFFA